jgi:hypothetical protein
MANESSLFQEQWDSRVITMLQQKGYLTRGMTMGPSKIVGKKLHFPIMGKGVAQPYTRGDVVKKMNVIKGQVEIDAAEWDAADDIYETDLDQMAANIKDATVEAAAMALGRQYDLVLYQKFQAKDFNTLSQRVGEFTEPFGPAEALKARRILFGLDAPVEDGMIFCGMPPIVFDTMMSYEVFANSQWVGGSLPFADGMRRRSWQNIHFFELPVYLQSVVSTDNGKFYMWHKSAAGSGHIGEELKTGWEYILNQKKWYYQSTLSAGVTLIEDPSATGHPLAAVECRYEADVEPTFT